MKITRKNVQPTPVVVDKLGVGCVYRLIKPTSSSDIDESRIYFRNADQMVPGDLISGTHMRRDGRIVKSSTCLTTGKLIIWGHGHEECAAIVLNVELIVKGDQV